MSEIIEEEEVESIKWRARKLSPLDLEKIDSDWLNKTRDSLYGRNGYIEKLYQQKINKVQQNYFQDWDLE